MTIKIRAVLLLPTKNEDWVLKSTLFVLKNYFDNILISDQNSTDKTLEIISSIKNLDIIKNNRPTHSNQVRWDLLDEARKRYGKNNLIVNIDADEFIPVKSFLKFKKKLHKFDSGVGFSSPWIQLWRSTKAYRNDKSIWNPNSNFKDFMFLDNGKLEYIKENVINDHTSRIPTSNLNHIFKLNFPLLHLQFANWERSQLKQIWYMCSEIINGVDASVINRRYRGSRDESGIKLSKVKRKWISSYNKFIDLDLNVSHDIWYLSEIKKMFEDKGIEYFSQLDIWENKFLKEIKKDFHQRNN